MIAYYIYKNTFNDISIQTGREISLGFLWIDN